MLTAGPLGTIPPLAFKHYIETSREACMAV
jgi:hypothetical protein